jgi:squalene-hopene/tetraprenyl-beta-curcumene cyclase
MASRQAQTSRPTGPGGRTAWANRPSGPGAPPPTVGRAVARARENLLHQQRHDGHWCGLLEGDSILESEYVLLQHFLGRGDGRNARKATRRLRSLQTSDGGWAMYPGGPPDVSASVKAYFVLKLQGDDPEASHMRRARDVIRALGGVPAVNTYTRIYLALFGQVDWARCPAIPPEMVLLPRWFPFNVDRMSSWSRSIFVPLSVLWALRPRVQTPAGVSLEDVRAGEPLPGSATPPSHPDDPDGDDAAVDIHADGGLSARAWTTFFQGADVMLRGMERIGATPLRRRALRAAEAWILTRIDRADGLGGVYPSIANAIMALRTLGYGDDHPAVASQYRALEKLEVDRGDTLQIQPSLSPVWDTAQALAALHAAGAPPRHPAVVHASEWLLEREATVPSDWRYGNPDGPVGGWCFEYVNEYYPDCDDTAEVLEALRPLAEAGAGDARRIHTARRRGLEWLLSMQNDDGGWGAFDRGCDFRPLVHVPFADHNAMLDPSSVDITGRIIDMLVANGMDPGHPVIRRAVSFILARQDEDGTWYGRWGCNRIYGSWLALTGLAAAGVNMDSEPVNRCVRWFRRRQNADGGWGETPTSYWDRTRRGVGPSTATQTAWVLLALLAAGRRDVPEARTAVDYLLRTQRADGSWHDEPWTATGFPKVFYLQYHMYDDYFPLLALARWGTDTREE